MDRPIPPRLKFREPWPARMASQDNADRRRSRIPPMPRGKATRRSQHASSCLASTGTATHEAVRRIVGIDRTDHEGRRAATNDRERNQVGLPIEREAYQLDRMGEWIDLADVVEHRAAFLHPPQRIQR